MVIANHKVAAGNAVANIACAIPGDCFKVARSCFKNLILLKASLLYLNWLRFQVSKMNNIEIIYL